MFRKRSRPSHNSPDKCGVRVEGLATRGSISKRIKVDRKTTGKVVRSLGVVRVDVYRRMHRRNRLLRRHHLLGHNSRRLLLSRHDELASIYPITKITQTQSRTTRRGRGRVCRRRLWCSRFKSSIQHGSLLMSAVWTDARTAHGPRRASFGYIQASLSSARRWRRRAQWWRREGRGIVWRGSRLQTRSYSVQIAENQRKQI